MTHPTPATFAATVLSLVCAACLFPTSHDTGSTSSPTPPSSGQCDIDLDCASSSVCKKLQCVAHACTESDAPQGVPAPSFDGSPLQCQKLVCDGHGGTQLLPDPTALPTGPAPACRRYGCDATGNATLEPDAANLPPAQAQACKKSTCDAAGNETVTSDPSNVPTDTKGDCKLDGCDASGNVMQTPAPSDVPADTKGDCMKDGCTATGTTSKSVDDTDAPAPTTCFSYACSGGVAKSTPINPTTNCSTMGFVCGADGNCATCPTPDAACTDPGPGSRAEAAAHDFGGIGRTDSGGRDFCGAVPSGQAEYYTYYDDGTGFLASFDPYFEIRPQVAAKMCVYFDCATVACPGGTTTDTLGGHPGCCWDGAAGVFTGHRIDFCSGARVTVKVTSATACAGYEAHFHD